ncbi:MAG TPA: hypothetical protein VGB76_19375 [Pyrinomonadaceae bacterium]|jgi:hypothetical protein
MNSYCFQPIFHLIESTPEFRALLYADVRKIGKYLIGYARREGIAIEVLTLLDLCDERAKILPSFVAFINERPRPKGKSEKEHVKYGKQILSRIKKIIKVLAAGLPNIQEVTGLPDDLLRSVPEFLRPVLIYLPRGNRRSALSPARLASPLTDRARLSLKAILAVTKSKGITTLYELFVTYWADLRTACYAGSPPADAYKVYSTLIHIRSNFGLHKKKSTRAFSLDDAPPRLREQIVKYMRLAPSGASGEPELRRLGLSKGIALERHEQSTIHAQVYCFLALLGRIPLREDMEIIDFIRMESRTVVEDGEEVPQLYNRIIDPFRQEERDKETPNKPQGFDSVLFRSAYLAIKSIAAYNGIFRHHKSFSEVYKTNLDHKGREDRKDEKKEAFPMSWLDYNLKLLRPQFDAIIADGSFKTDIEALEKCMCYVYLMMLRYTGVRQQGLRVCKIGWNVMFNKNGSITFHWRVDEIKNDKDFTCTIKPGHTSTFALLVKTLRRYRQHIYPFLVDTAHKAGVDLEGQLFIEVLADGSVRRFGNDHDGSRKFADTFKNLTSRFLDFTDIKPAMRRKFNAHHIRGIAGDWMHHDLGVGTEGTAKFLANNRLTTERLYVDKKRIDSTQVLDEADKRAALKKAGHSTFSADIIDTATPGSAHEQQIAHLTAQNEVLQSKVDIVTTLLEDMASRERNNSTSD